MNPSIKIIREEYHTMEATSKVRTLNGHETRTQELSQYIPKSISQKDLKKIKNETEMLTDILKRKETTNFCIKEEESAGWNLTIFDIVMDLSHIYVKFFSPSLSMKNCHNIMTRQYQVC